MVGVFYGENTARHPRQHKDGFGTLSGELMNRKCNEITENAINYVERILINRKIRSRMDSSQ